MRPRVDASDELENRVHEYARENGIRPPRAWAELTAAGLDDRGDA